MLKHFTYLISFLSLGIIGCRPADVDQSAPATVHFAAPWTSTYSVDSSRPHHLVNGEGRHLWILNKTAWAYFGCANPEQVLQKAQKQGVNVLRVALEGRPYFQALGIDMWPWGGDRQKPDWHTFNEKYWEEVEKRIEMAGEAGIGLDLVLYFSYKPTIDEFEMQKSYLDQALKRLGKYANLLAWEIMNEYIENEAFQDAAGAYLKDREPFGRPICSSDGTTEDALWPHKDWMDLAIVHTCTGNQPQYDLEHWYLSIARNTRQYAKPAFNNESGRENRHKNDDPVHRRKQGWLWTAAGAFWTWHSWEGCEGIDDPDYYGPGWESLKPMADFYRQRPFQDLEPNYTVLNVRDASLIHTALATPSRSEALMYVCTRETGRRVKSSTAFVRLRDGEYQFTCLNPMTLDTLRTMPIKSSGLRRDFPVDLPAFTDDLLVHIRLLTERERSLIEGTL